MESSKSVKYWFKNQKGFDEVKRVFSRPFSTHRLSLGITALNTLRIWLSGSLFFLMTGCSVPDLGDRETYETALREAKPLGKLSHKRMYGMIMLYVDSNDKPFTGWVRDDWDSVQIKELGYLEDGQKQGTWMKWHKQGEQASEAQWENNLLEGSFQTWHPNGKLHQTGQTKDGEVDGEWKSYYPNGQLAEITLNQNGHLVQIKVWRPNGNPCRDSLVSEGSGGYNVYDENGSLQERRIFRNGIEIANRDKP